MLMNFEQSDMNGKNYQPCMIFSYWLRASEFYESVTTWAPSQREFVGGGGYSEPHLNIMGPPGILGLLIAGKKVEYWYSSTNLDAK